MTSEFQECNDCAVKLGSPTLCGPCLNNRALIQSLKRQETREERMRPVKLTNGNTAHVDPEIQTLVQCLNDGGFQTVASCSGHGHRPSTIALRDGRELLILRNFKEARSIEHNWPDINGEVLEESRLSNIPGLGGAVEECLKDIKEYLNNPRKDRP